MQEMYDDYRRQHGGSEEDHDIREENPKFKLFEKISDQIKDVTSVMEPQVKNAYREKNPLIEELEKELEFLEREHMDLLNRGQKIEQQIYDRSHYLISKPFSESQGVFPNKNYEHDYMFYS